MNVRFRIRLAGTQSEPAPHFGPAGCDTLCVNLLAAGVLDRVIFRTDKSSRVLSREATGKGCESNLFSRKHQGRAFRLQLAGVCLAATDLQGPPYGFQADIIFEMLNDWNAPRFRPRPSAMPRA